VTIVPLPASIEVTADIERAVQGAETLVVAIPTAFLRQALTNIAPFLTSDRPMVSVIKGMENETFMRPSEIIGEVLGNRAVVVLSGPSHAEEISRRLPATVVAASGDFSLAKQVQQMFSTDRFRVYTNLDIVGVELAAALKNIVAIAAGISDGLGYGDNAKAALMTRGLVEMTRFGVALGAEPVTFSGLAGFGDLVTTCISPYSRNRGVGQKLGEGQTLDQILASMDAIAEGVLTSRSVHEYSEKLGLEMPITQEVYEVLFEGKSPVAATNALMMRPPKGE
jgi:glycerol-3-phosphate dehydrogenase (NAD(P)+)